MYPTRLRRESQYYQEQFLVLCREIYFESSALEWASTGVVDFHAAKEDLGASRVQVQSPLVYEGPIDSHCTEVSAG